MNFSNSKKCSGSPIFIRRAFDFDPEHFPESSDSSDGPGQLNCKVFYNLGWSEQSVGFRIFLHFKLKSGDRSPIFHRRGRVWAVKMFFGSKIKKEKKEPSGHFL